MSTGWAPASWITGGSGARPSVPRGQELKVWGPSLLMLVLRSPSVATASDPAGPSYAAATLQASSAASSSSPASRAAGSASKVRAAAPVGGEGGEELEASIHLTPQPQEFPKGKRKLDLNQEERKTPSKPTAQPSPPARKKPKCEQIGLLVPVGACAPVSRGGEDWGLGLWT